MNYRDALGWLYATQRFGIKLGLENTERLLRELQLTSPTARIVHVAGTNGKGSVCAMIDSICRVQGLRTGLFTSPHLVTFRERIRVDGEMISAEEVAAGLTRLRHLVDGWEPHPTFFEITTVLALLHFERTRCEIVVLETGMGGRLDATNALTPAVAVLTPIALDHQKWLGSSLSAIALEKAGIIKPGVPVVTARQPPEAAEVIHAAAAERNAPLREVEPPDPARRVGLAGPHQRENAAVAVAALSAARIEVSAAAIATGLERVEWPGRFQRWDDRVIIDGAHNPAGMERLVSAWRDVMGEARATVILAILRDKEADEMIRGLAPLAARFVLPQIGSERALPPPLLEAAINRVNPATPASVADDFPAGLETARSYSEPILITGSLHFVGEALAHLRGDSYEDCAQ